MAGERLASAHSVLKEDKRQGTLLATLAGGSLALATDFARQALSALVECSFRGSAFPTFPDVYRLCLQYAHLYTMPFEHVAMQEAGKVVENKRP